jgi:WD40 repeat protein
MKIKNVVTVWLVAFSLASCLPAANVVPTETNIPPSTFTPIPPTSTITPEPFNRMVTVNGAVEKKILDIAFSPEGTKLAIYANTGIYIYDTNTLDMATFQRFEDFNYDMYVVGAEVGALAFAFDENTIAISGKTANTPVELWDINTGDHVMSITDIPPSSGVIKIQFSPDSNSIFIRSFYGFTSRCEQADANFSLHLLDFSESPKATKVFSKDICQIVPTGFIRFADSNKFLVFVQTFGHQYLVTTLDITLTADSQEIAYNNSDTLYNVSPGGKIYAFMSGQENSRVTKLIDSQTSQVLEIIPYEVKFFDDSKNHFLIREFFPTDSEWQLWENGNISCNFKGLISKDFEFSTSGKIFATTTPDMNVIIWNVSDCSTQNVIYFGG